MTAYSVTHASFVIERTFKQAPERVFNAFANPAAKARWFSGPSDQWKEKLRQFDFRVGGREQLIGTWTGGKTSSFDAYYQDIVPNERIIYAYGMKIDGVPISVSLATIEFKRAASGTLLVITEQGAFLDGYEDGGSRENGTGMLLDRLAASLERAPVAALEGCDQ
jgi:uncharacterized protein YndB with AHSA1/START domain